MANRRKAASERKTEKISIRISPRRKAYLEKLARLRGFTMTEALDEILEEFLEVSDWKSKEIWKYLKAAGQIIDESENKWRRGENL